MSHTCDILTRRATFERKVGRNLAILVPGVVQTTVTGHISNHKFNQVLHWHNVGMTGGWTAANVLALVNGIMTAYSTNFRSLFGPGTIINNVLGIDLSSTTPAEVTSTVAGFTCTGASQMAPSLSMMVNLTISKRYRGGHPRTYFPSMPGTSMNVTEDGWSATAMTAAQSAVNAFKTAVESSVSGTSWAVPLYIYEVTNDTAKQRYIRTKVALDSIQDVTSAVVSPVIRSQRRRMTSGS